MTTDEIRARTEKGIALQDLPAFIDEMLAALETLTAERDTANKMRDIAVNLRRSTTASALGFAKQRNEAREALEDIWWDRRPKGDWSDWGHIHSWCQKRAGVAIGEVRVGELNDFIREREAALETLTAERDTPTQPDSNEPDRATLRRHVATLREALKPLDGLARKVPHDTSKSCEVPIQLLRKVQSVYARTVLKATKEVG